MLGISIGFVLVSLIVGVICYLTTTNIIFSIAIFLIYIAYFFIYQYKRFKNYYGLVRRVHSCYFFVNSFVISMSVKESYEEGFQSGLRANDPQLHLFAKELEGLSDYEKVKYLRSYFNLAIYKMFLNILEIYQDQGGNILAMSENLISEATRVEKTLTESSSLGLKHIIEFMILWVLSFVVILFMKFGIKDFYNQMLSDPMFVPLIVIYFLICLVSIHFFLNAFVNLSIKEDNIE